MRPSLLFVMAAVSLGPLAAGADAAENKAKALYKQAQTHYDVAEFDQALKLYSEAYKMKPLPGFLFNIGQCHRQLKNHERAMFFFQRFLDTAPPNNPTVEMARTLLDEVKAKHEAESQPPTPAVLLSPTPDPASGTAAASSSAPAELKAPPSDVPTQPTLAPPREGSTLPPPAPEAEAPVYKRWWFWTAIGGAVAAGAVVGVVATRPRPVTPSLGTINGR